MTLDKHTRAKLRAHCLNLHDDDGVDPREFFQPSRGRRQDNRKARQLCRQVAETLDQVLAGETADELVSSLHIDSVIPAPDAARLLVTVRTDLRGDANLLQRIQQRLADHRGRLRCAVSATITRRKTPNLEFRILGTASSEVQP
jgi:ribosome-binding factor A